MSMDTESCDTQDIDSYMNDTEYLNLCEVRMVPPYFYKKGKRVEK